MLCNFCDRLPRQVADIAVAHVPRVIQRKQVQPAIVEQRADAVMARKDVVDRCLRGFDDDRQAQGFMGQVRAVLHGLTGQARAQQPAIAFDHAELLFEMISQRYERGATLITSNLPFDEWTEVFGSERLTGALLDRLTHHVNILEMNGESYRLAQSRARKSTDTA